MQCILIVHYGHLKILFWWKKSRIVRYLQVWQNMYYDFHKIGWLKIVERSIIMSCVDQFCRRKLDFAHHAKGQIISKWFFGVFNFLLKTNKNKSIWGIIVVKSNSFVRFLEEMEDTKKPFRNYLTFSMVCKI